MGYIHDTRVYNPMPLIIRGNVLQSRGRVDWLPDANASQPSLTFSTDPDTGLYRPGENQLALATGGVDRAVFDLHGANITGTLVASSHVVGSAFFGDGGGLGNIQVSNVVGLSDALQTVEANTVTANVVTAGTFFGDGSALTGLVQPLSIANVQITDNTWGVIDDTAVGLAGGDYVLVNGIGFAPSSLCQIGGTNASSTSYVSSSQLRVITPAKAAGSYDVSLIRGDTVTATLPSAVTYSDAVVWTTASNLGNVFENTAFTIELQATSDSVVTYANVDPLPPQTTLDSVTGNLSGNITSVTDSTLYSFGVRATDQELQGAILTCLLNFIALTLSSVQLTDVSWSNITQTALDSNSTGYLVVSGQGLDQTDDVLIDGTSVTSFTKVGSTALRVAAPSKPRGTYDVSVQYGSQTKTLANAVYYSDVPVWTNIPVVATNEIKLVPSDSEASANFGSSCSVSADGSRVVVGAIYDDATGGSDSGAAYIFQNTYLGYKESWP